MAKKNAMDRLAKKQEQLDDLQKRIEKIRKEMSEINNAQNKKWTAALQAALNKNRGSIDLARIATTLMLDNQFYETRFSKSKFIACEFEGNSFHKASLDNIDTVKQCKMSGNRFLI